MIKISIILLTLIVFQSCLYVSRAADAVSNDNEGTLPLSNTTTKHQDTTATTTKMNLRKLISVSIGIIPYVSAPPSQSIGGAGVVLENETTAMPTPSHGHHNGSSNSSPPTPAVTPIQNNNNNNNNTPVPTTQSPTNTPTKSPIAIPTNMPSTKHPTYKPTYHPTHYDPTTSPSIIRTPTVYPTTTATTAHPTRKPMIQTTTFPPTGRNNNNNGEERFLVVLNQFKMELAFSAPSATSLSLAELLTIAEVFLKEVFEDDLGSTYNVDEVDLRITGWEQQRRRLKMATTRVALSFVTVHFQGRVFFRPSYVEPDPKVVRIVHTAAFVGSSNSEFLARLKGSKDEVISSTVQVIVSVENSALSKSDTQGIANENVLSHKDVLVVSFLVMSIIILTIAVFVTILKKKQRKTSLSGKDSLNRTFDTEPAFSPGSGVRPSPEPIVSAATIQENHHSLGEVDPFQHSSSRSSRSRSTSQRRSKSPKTLINYYVRGRSPLRSSRGLSPLRSIPEGVPDDNTNNPSSSFLTDVGSVVSSISVSSLSNWISSATLPPPEQESKHNTDTTSHHQPPRHNDSYKIIEVQPYGMATIEECSETSTFRPIDENDEQSVSTITTVHTMDTCTRANVDLVLDKLEQVMADRQKKINSLSPSRSSPVIDDLTINGRKVAELAPKPAGSTVAVPRNFRPPLPPTTVNNNNNNVKSAFTNTTTDGIESKLQRDQKEQEEFMKHILTDDTRKLLTPVSSESEIRHQTAAAGDDSGSVVGESLNDAPETEQQNSSSQEEPVGYFL